MLICILWAICIIKLISICNQLTQRMAYISELDQHRDLILNSTPMFSTPRNTSSMVSYMQYELICQKSNMATAAMLDFEKNSYLGNRLRQNLRFWFHLHVIKPVELIWHGVVNVALIVTFGIQYGCRRPTWILTKLSHLGNRQRQNLHFGSTCISSNMELIQLDGLFVVLDFLS